MPEDDDRSLASQGGILPPAISIPPVEFWKRPQFRYSVFATILLAPAGWCASQFFQLRGFVNIAALRVDLAICVILLIVWIWIVATNFKRFRFVIPSLVTLVVITGALAIDHYTLPEAEAKPAPIAIGVKPPASDNSGPKSPAPVMKRVKPPKPKPAPTVAPLATVHIVCQHQIASADSDMPFGLEALITTDNEITPMALDLIFSGEVGRFQASMPIGVILEQQGGIRVASPDIVFMQRKSPGFTPDVPLKVVVFSKTSIKLNKIESVAFDFALPQGALK